MQLLLQFMYNGLVNVKQEKLNQFLALAERLNVRGLTKNKETICPTQSANSHPPPLLYSNTHIEEPSELSQELSIVKQEQEHSFINEDIDAQSDIAAKEEENVYVDLSQSSASEVLNPPNNSNATDYGYSSRPKHEAGYCILCERNYGNMAIHFEDFHNNRCPYCLVEIKIKRNLQRHIEDKHEPTSNPCDICGKIYSSPNKLNNHKFNSHKVRAGVSKFQSNVSNFF